MSKKISRLITFIILFMLIFNDVVGAISILEEVIYWDDEIEKVLDSEEIIEEIDSIDDGFIQYEVVYMDSSGREFYRSSGKAKNNSMTKIRADEEYKGYLLQGENEKYERINEENREIKFYYEKKSEGNIFDYTIKYVTKRHGKKVDILDEKKGKAFLNSSLSIKPPNIPGYKLLEEIDSKELIIDGNSKNEIIFEYKKSVLNRGDTSNFTIADIPLIFRAVDEEGEPIVYEGNPLEIRFDQMPEMDKYIYDSRIVGEEINEMTNGKYILGYEHTEAVLDIGKTGCIVDVEFLETIKQDESMYIIEHIGDKYFLDDKASSEGKKEICTRLPIQKRELGIGKPGSRLKAFAREELEYSKHYKTSLYVKSLGGEYELVESNDIGNIEFKLEVGKVYKVIFDYDIKYDYYDERLDIDILNDNIIPKDEIIKKLYIRHLDDLNEDELLKSEEYLRTISSVEVIYYSEEDIPGYIVIEDRKSKKIDEDVNYIDFRYKLMDDDITKFKVYHYGLENKEDFQDESKHKLLKKEIGTGYVGRGETQREKSEEFKDYEFYSIEEYISPKTITLKKDENENIFKFYYLGTGDGSEELDKAQYRVNYYLEDTNEKIRDSDIFSNFHENKIKVYPGREIEGYSLISKKPIIIILDKDQIKDVNFYYTKNMEGLIPYRVSYVEQIEYEGSTDTYERDIISPKVAFGKEGTIIKGRMIEFQGYDLIEKIDEITLEEGGNNHIKFIYKRNDEDIDEEEIEGEEDKDKYAAYKVKYNDDNGEELFETEEYTRAIIGTIVGHNAIPHNDYTVDEKYKEIKIEKENNEIIFNYRLVTTGGGGTGGGGGGGNPPARPEEEDKEEIQFDRDNHNSYIEGYPDGTVRPRGDIKRDEVATIIFRLLDKSFRDDIRTSKHDFEDILPGRWSEESVASLTSIDVVEGYGDGSFRPSNNATRAEVATLLARMNNLEEKPSSPFEDVKDHWASGYISAMEEKGWIEGYTDNEFRPNQSITRAEFVTMVNNMLDRKTLVENMSDDRKEFKDLEDWRWYYADMQEAINGHMYRIKDGLEIWEELIE